MMLLPAQVEGGAQTAEARPRGDESLIVVTARCEKVPCTRSSHVSCAMDAGCGELFGVPGAIAAVLGDTAIELSSDPLTVKLCRGRKGLERGGTGDTPTLQPRSKAHWHLQKQRSNSLPRR